MKPKVVLVTGAGFTAKAGVPVQSGILSKIVEFRPTTSTKDRRSFDAALAALTKFLNRVFLQRGESLEINHDDYSKLQSLALEDLYTILDKGIARREWFPFHDWGNLIQVRESLDLCVALYMTAVQNTYGGHDYDDLAGSLMELCGNDWATITLNWDTIWDKSLSRVLVPAGIEIDYAGPITRLNEAHEIANVNPGTRSVKLVKLHGSFNWAVCPRCRSLFVSGQDIGYLTLTDLVVCPLCAPDPEAPQGPGLQPLFLTPTIIKTFDNPILNLMWDNAIHVLADATHVVFVGYSFPLADHDLRYLLRKALPSRVHIAVVLSGHDDPSGVPLHVRGKLPHSSFKAFFGLEDSAFYFTGWERFFRESFNTWLQAD